MRKLRLNQLADTTEGHFLAPYLPGAYLCAGALSFKPPNLRTHTAEGANGDDRHIHADYEAFVILQGKVVMEIDGEQVPLTPGDVLIVEPGEDHHLISDSFDPCINLWLHAGPQRNPAQLAQP
ncbi:MAG: cupin domain-containing protein [Chloroflexi bacterium]|nr:cupin domain-containing protein [Chloroflexota bacterium]